MILLVLLLLGIPPTPTRWVTDTAGFVSDATRANLDDKLEAYEKATGHQVVVWIGDSLDGEDLAKWSNATFTQWRLGRAHADDGVAVFVFKTDRQIAIEVGYGLEDKLTDATSSRIIREVMAPALRDGKPDDAMTAGVDAILASVEGKPWVGSSTVQPAAEQGHLTWIVGAVLLIAFLLFAAKRPGAALMFLTSFMPDRGGGMRGGYRGGFRGGGGRSGGGGARGGW